MAPEAPKFAPSGTEEPKIRYGPVTCAVRVQSGAVTRARRRRTGALLALGSAVLAACSGSAPHYAEITDPPTVPAITETSTATTAVRTTTPATTTAASTAAPSPVPQTRPPLRGLGDVWEVELPEVPLGTFDADPTDLVTVTADGTVWWHPRALSDEPRQPVAVGSVRVDLPDRIPTFGGFVNGSLLLHDGDALHATMAYPAPGAEPASLGDRGELSVSPNGARLAAAPLGNPHGVVVFDWQAGIAVRFGVMGFQYAWTPDNHHLIMLNHPDEGGYVLERRRPDRAFEVTESVLLANAADVYLHVQTADGPYLVLAGVWDGDVVVLVQPEQGTRAVRLPATDFRAEPVADPWWPSRVFAVTADNSAALEQVGESGSRIVFRGDRSPIDLPDALYAFFVPPPFATP